MPYDIPFNRPFMVGNELAYIRDAVERGHLAGDGAYTQKCHEWMERTFRAHKVLLTPSCTAALEMAALLSGLHPGDEVILPSFTFVSTANAFVLHGARPVFVDIRPDTLNVDEAQIEAALTSRTRVIVATHYAGVACDMDRIMALAARREITVVEDAAQGVNATYKGRYLGTLGHLGCYSFHETKNVIAGEGGALLVNREADVERAEIIREKGTDRSRFFRGQVDKYRWVSVGSSYLPSELVAAFLYAQLEECDRITRQRRGIYDYYAQQLAPLEQKGVLRLPRVPKECEPNGHMFYVLLADEAARDRLIAHLKVRSILAVFHYVPLHTSPMGRRYGYAGGELPVTESSSDRLLRLPCYYAMTRSDQDRVIEGIESYFV
jgi:dTDP-4-amino-4,6-dideoxygalactose transaminase